MRENSKCVLVDDDPDWIILVRHAIRQTGLPVSIESFHDAEAALEQLRTQRADMIITDLHLPGMDGLTFVRALRQRDAVTPTIMISSDSRFRNQALQSGADAFLCKESAQDDLLSTVKRYLRVPAIR